VQNATCGAECGVAAGCSVFEFTPLEVLLWT
jgi:hypothetical protein